MWSMCLLFKEQCKLLNRQTILSTTDPEHQHTPFQDFYFLNSYSSSFLPSSLPHTLIHFHSIMPITNYFPLAGTQEFTISQKQSHQRQFSRKIWSFGEKKQKYQDCFPPCSLLSEWCNGVRFWEALPTIKGLVKSWRNHCSWVFRSGSTLGLKEKEEKRFLKF